MAFSSRSFASLIVAAFVLCAGEVMAQENTPAACADRVDNDGDGYVDCADQDCSYMNFCAPGGPPSARLSTGWALSGAIVGFSAAPVIVGLAIGAEVTLGHPAIPGALGGTALLLGIALGPITAVSAISARRSAGVRGCVGCRIVAWISYGLFIVDGAVLIGLGISPDTDPPHGTLASFGVLGALSLCLFGADALVSRRQALSRSSSTPTTPNRRWSIAPFVAPIGDRRGVDGAVAGVTIVSL